jgi:2-amino-4-hydroxy-6-hydroxymethyldihydropteridine diphosphokinase
LDRVAVALGSNLGDRTGHLDHAVARLQSVIHKLRVSRYQETAPYGVTGPQPLYMNAVAVGQVRLTPRAFLDALLAIERERGRERPHPQAPRTLDLDLILFGDLVSEDAGLTIPHPRFRERRFVLEPLMELAPELVDPVTRLTVRELLTRMA